MREQVEQFPRIDASLVRWAGLLETRWDGETPCEPLPWRLIREDSESSYWGDAAPWATYRVTGSRPIPGGGGEAVLLELDFIADQAAVFGKPGMTWATRFEFASKPAQFGGRRWWLVCTGCRHRRAHLYPFAPGLPWLCRECLGLTYKSRQEVGHAARHGNGWGAVGYALDRGLRGVAARSRRSFRRAIHRVRAAHR